MGWNRSATAGQTSGPVTSPGRYGSSSSAGPPPATRKAAIRNGLANPSIPSQSDQLARPGSRIVAPSADRYGSTAASNPSASASQWALVHPVYGLSVRSSGGRQSMTGLQIRHGGSLS
ncbi:hypothetical protein HD597_000123 [Nonomuraea thailandensis]|uniref:Uncharacterized protein n=1 Tax=Nonomuraea thailandensis TaxID=1188745 RepID=A0A9X2GEA1_9ACTN|nr:hypothetical protein [Nonomuraea thailandensis]MCP2353103.1 hypothetical protein [Nonomuraea thailandensis]